MSTIWLTSARYAIDIRIAFLCLVFSILSVLFFTFIDIGLDDDLLDFSKKKKKKKKATFDMTDIDNAIPVSSTLVLHLSTIPDASHVYV